MKTTELLLDIPELKIVFSERKFVQKSDLKDFYSQRQSDLTEQAFRRILYALEKQSIMLAVGSGVYLLQVPALPVSSKKKFSPPLSGEIEALHKIIHTSFPHIQYLVWETRVLHEFMTRQPGISQIILATEKEVCESVFNHLIDQYASRVFLEPDRITVERYVLRIPDSIIVSRLVTQAPKKIVQGVPVPQVEKILVDILADDEKFYMFQGQELIQIYENVFSTYWINEKTLFRYAGRRKVAIKLLDFIQTQTKIQLLLTEKGER
jgi:hypothetical protein